MQVRKEYYNAPPWGNSTPRAVEFEEVHFSWLTESGCGGPCYSSIEEARWEAPQGAQIIELRQSQVLHGRVG